MKYSWKREVGKQMIINNTETIFIKLYINFKVIGSIQRKLHNWWVWHSYKRPLIPSQGDSLLDYISCNEAQNYMKKNNKNKIKSTPICPYMKTDTISHKSHASNSLDSCLLSLKLQVFIIITSRCHKPCHSYWHLRHYRLLLLT